MNVHEILSFFIPLLVSIDAFGLVPLFLSLTAGTPLEIRRQITFEAVSFAFAICLGFMLLGNFIFSFLGITQADFRIAGGILLLVLAIIDLLIRGKPSVEEGESVGIFPLAMPLIAGPATITTTLVLAARPHGYALTSLSLAVNFAILTVLLLISDKLSRFLGSNALRAISKLVMVLLAAIAVNLIRTGIAQTWSAMPHQ